MKKCREQVFFPVPGMYSRSRVLLQAAPVCFAADKDKTSLPDRKDAGRLFIADDPGPCAAIWPRQGLPHLQITKKKADVIMGADRQPLEEDPTPGMLI